MSSQPKTVPPPAVERIANFTAAAQTERLTPEVRRPFKRNILRGPRGLPDYSPRHLVRPANSC